MWYVAPDADADPAERVTAYCAPGMKEYATRLLESRGEGFREMIEHPYLAGHMSVILTTDPGPASSLAADLDFWSPPAGSPPGPPAEGRSWEVR